MRSFYLFVMAALLSPALSFAQPCECTNCPVEVTDNGTFFGYLDVSLSGPNDLGQCPLQQVCFQITHTWIGDLSISLISPSGLNYLVMADSNNDFGGCGNLNDNIDVCIDVGTGNPLTNNTDYMCNGTDPCLTGNWTVPCGGVTDPVGGALQAPNCDLDDFNVPGNPANGTWTLVINDICDEDIGTLDAWSLTFACGINDCFSCEANGGTLNQPDVSGCFPTPGLNLNITPSYPLGTPPPPPSDYSYTFVYSLNGIIMGFVNGPNLNNLPPGNYQVCGLSYLTTDAGLYNVYIGQPYNNLVNDLNNASAGFCGDLSTDCFNATIYPMILPTIIDTTMCLGDCFTAPTGIQCCAPGGCQYTLTSSTGCDSLIIFNITPIPPESVQVTETLCPNECITIDGTDYCPPGNYNIQLTNQQGCDSIVQLTLLSVPVAAVINPPPPITCDIPVVQLIGSNSIGSTYEWQDSNGQTLGNLPILSVNTAGTYSLIVGNTLNGVTCFDTAQVTVVENLILPDPPVLSGPLSACPGDNTSYSITNIQPDVTYNWTIPAGATILSGGNGFPGITLQWDNPPGGDVCATATSSCATSNPGCITVSIDSIPPIGNISGNDIICAGAMETYSIPAVPGAVSYTWTTSCGSIVSGQGTEAIQIDWTGCNNGGQICVMAQVNCGSTSQTCMDVSATTAPATPVLNGPTTGCFGGIDTFCVNADPNVSSYNWSFNNLNATITSGQGTNCITVSWNDGNQLGEVCVEAVNDCGSSPQSCIPVIVPDYVPPFVIGPDTLCTNDTAVYTAGDIIDNWVVDCGTIIASDPVSITVVWNAGTTNCQVCATTQQCFGPETFCLPVSVLNPPAPNAGPDDAICGLSIQLNATGNGQWSTNSGPGNAAFSDPADPTAQVTVDTYGSYTFTWTADNGYCTGSDEVQIDFNSNPAIVSAIDELCSIDSLFYTVSFTIGNGQAPYSVTGSVSGTLSGNAFTSDPIPSGMPYSFDITDVNGCGPYQLNGAHQCFCTTDAGSMDSNLAEACEDETITVNPATGAQLDPEDILIYVLQDQPTGLGNVFASSPVPSFNLQPGMNTDVTYYIAAAAGNDLDADGQIDNSDPCIDISDGQPVIWHAYPVADAGPDDAVCGLSIQLGATPSIGNGQWSMSSGPGNAAFANNTDPATQVTVDAYGSYTFTWMEDNNSCTDQDEVIITFNDAPVADSPVASCDLLNLSYTITFNISGGTPPYAVSGSVSGTLSGNAFTSDPIPAGSSYNFDITDANGCGPYQLSGSHECPCTTDAGSMDSNLAEACEDETITVNPATGAQLDPEDILIYVLQDQPDGLGNVFDTSSTPSFALQAGMSTNTTYYIAAMAGNDLDADGQIDSNDPCIDISDGQPVIWYSLPEADLISDATVCEGETAMITVAVNANSCINLQVQTSAGDTLNFNCINDGDQIAIPTAQDDLTLSILGISDDNNCQNTSAGTAQITVNITPEASLTPTASVCNSTDSGSLPTELNFDDFILSGDATGSWANTDGAAIQGSFPLISFEGAEPGDYTFTYTTGSALPPCENQSYTMTVTVENCVCPSLELSTPPDLCNGGDVLDLSGLSANAAPGIWSISSTPAGSSPATLNGNMLDATGADAGTYQLTYTLTDAPPTGCPNQNTVSLSISEELSAGTPEPAPEFCFGESQTVALFALLQGADAGGSWEEISQLPSSGNAFDANAGTFQIDGQVPGTYRFRYTVTPEAPCQPEQAEVEVIIQALPVANAGADLALTCFEPVATLGGDSNQSQPVSYAWTSDNGILPEPPDALHPEVSLPGTYTLTVTSLLTGCQASDEVVVEDLQDTPQPSITLIPISCYGKDDGAIVIENIEGGTPPYLVSFNGQPFSDQLYFTNLAPDVYSIIVQDVNGCQNEPLTIDMAQPQELNVNIIAYVEADNTIVLGDSVQLAAQVSIPMEEVDSIAWSPADIMSCDTCFATWAHPLESTTFSVMVESNGCTDSDQLTIAVRKNRPIYVPNAFSPNGDGNNDVFYINAGPQVAKIRSFLIFNRWGETVFQYYNFPPNDPAFGWDGRYRGQDVNPAVYVWYAEIEFLDGSSELYKGDIILVR